MLAAMEAYANALDGKARDAFIDNAHLAELRRAFNALPTPATTKIVDQMGETAERVLVFDRTDGARAKVLRDEVGKLRKSWGLSKRPARARRAS